MTDPDDARELLGLYVLDAAGDPVGPVEMAEWGAWMEGNHPVPAVGGPGSLRVGWYEHEDGTVVSTVFLAVDHNFGRGGAPLLFETLVFSDGMPGRESLILRSHTRVEAEYRHQFAVLAVQAGLLNDADDEL